MVTDFFSHKQFCKKDAIFVVLEKRFGGGDFSIFNLVCKIYKVMVTLRIFHTIIWVSLTSKKRQLQLKKRWSVISISIKVNNNIFYVRQRLFKKDVLSSSWFFVTIWQIVSIFHFFSQNFKSLNLGKAKSRTAISKQNLI